MKLNFNSLFAEHLTAFVQAKNAVGFPYNSPAEILGRFDKFCLSHFPTEATLTRELCFAWAKKRDIEKITTLHTRIAPIRELAKFLIRRGKTAFVLPDDFAKGGVRHLPHIFTEEEISAFWQQLDKLEPRKQYPYRHLVMPAIFRLLYCCGLRPAEALKLSCSDVSLEIGRINIRESKGHKDRIVILADDLLDYLQTYDTRLKNLFPVRDAFFPNSIGKGYSHSALQRTFVQEWAKANIKGIRPRIFDFRHTFATHRLYQWMREGKDVSAYLPYLSAYMGHEKLSGTLYYLHMVPGLFEEMSKIDYSAFQKLLPEVEDYE